MATLQLRPGDAIDGYTIVRYLGKGSTSLVYEVQDKSASSCALKIFAPDHKLSNYTKDLFLMEYNATLGIEHPNVLSNIDVGVYMDRPYLVMTICEDNLFSFIKQLVDSNDKVSEKYIALIINHICRGLLEINNKGLIHNDIKPANILIKTQPSLTFVLSDFGISAKFRKTMLKETMIAENIYSGITPNYAAPERFKGRASQKSDIFSLGVILYEIIYGNLPLEDTEFAPGQGLDNGRDFTFPKREFSNRITKILKACLSLDLSERPSSNQLVKWTDYYVVNEYWPADVDALFEDSPNEHWVEESKKRYKASGGGRSQDSGSPFSHPSSYNSNSSPKNHSLSHSPRASSSSFESASFENKVGKRASDFQNPPIRKKTKRGLFSKFTFKKKSKGITAPKVNLKSPKAGLRKPRAPRVNRGLFSKVMRWRRLIRNPKLMIMPLLMLVPAAYLFVPALRGTLRMGNKVNRMIPKSKTSTDTKIIQCGNEMYGLESKSGDLLIPCVYDELSYFVKVGKDNAVGIYQTDGKCGFIDIKNTITQTYTVCKFIDESTGYASWTNEYGTQREARINFLDRFR